MSTTTTSSDEALRLWREKLQSPKPIPAFEFDPPPVITERILSDLNSSELSFAQVAERANTSTQTLAIWLARPDIAPQMDAMESMLRRRARLSVINHVDAITDTCATVMERFCRAPDRGIGDRPDTASHAVCTRNASNALMATRIMLHMARFLDGDPRAPRREAPRPAPKPRPSPEPDLPADSAAPATDRLPSLADITSVNLHDARLASLTTPNNPARDNASTSPSRKRRSDASSWAHEMGPRWLPDAPASGNSPNVSQAHEMGDRTPRNTATPAAPISPGMSLQPEGLKLNSRGLSESSSATPGKPTLDLSHPERVQLPIAPALQPCAGHLTPHKRKPCKGCAPASTTLLTITGTSTPRARDPTKS